MRAERESEVVLLSKELGHTVLGSGVGGVGGGGEKQFYFQRNWACNVGICVWGGGGVGGGSQHKPSSFSLSAVITLGDTTNRRPRVYIYTRGNRHVVCSRAYIYIYTHVKGA